MKSDSSSIPGVRSLILLFTTPGGPLFFYLQRLAAFRRGRATYTVIYNYTAINAWWPSGADVQRIQNMMGTLVRESEMKNIEVTFEALKAFYQVSHALR